MAADEREGRPQLVRDRGDEARLERVESARHAQVPQDRDRARRRARHSGVARRDRDRRRVDAGDDLLADERPPVGQDLPERAAATAAATRRPDCRKAPQEGFARDPDPLARGRSDEPRRSAVEAGDPAVGIHRDDRVTRAVEDRGQRRPLVQERAAKLGGAEREGQLAPDQPEVAGMAGVQRPAMRRSDREVAERDVARPALARRAALLERDAEPAGAGRPAACGGGVGERDGKRGSVARFACSRPDVWPERRDPAQRSPRRSCQPERGGLGAARAGDLREDRRRQLLQVVARGEQLAQLVLGEHRVRLALGLVEDAPPLVLEARHARPQRALLVHRRRRAGRRAVPPVEHGANQEEARGRARVAMASRAFAQPQGESPSRDHRDRGARRRPGPPAPPRTNASSGRSPAAAPARRARVAGSQGIEDRLVADRAPAATGETGPARVERAGEGGQVHGVTPVQREPGLDEQRPVEGAAGTADAGDQRVPDPAEQCPDVQPGHPLCRGLVGEGSDHGLEARRHVRSVIAVAERGVEPVEERLVPGDGRRRAPDERDDVRSRDRDRGDVATHRRTVGSL